jgi:hypothetical protein
MTVDQHLRLVGTTPLTVPSIRQSDEYFFGRVPRGRDFLGPHTGQDFLSANLGRGTRSFRPDLARDRQWL